MNMRCIHGALRVQHGKGDKERLVPLGQEAQKWLKLYLEKVRPLLARRMYGRILCAGKKRETIEYLNLDERGIHVAEYLTELPPRELLRQRFSRALAAASARIEQQRQAGALAGQ